MDDLWSICEGNSVELIADFGYDLGIQYQKTIERTDKTPYTIVVGATYGLAIDYATNTDETQLTFSGTDEIVGNNEVEDFIFQNTDVEGVMQLPSEMGVGFSLEKEQQWMIAADYKTTDWGSIESNNEVFNSYRFIIFKIIINCSSSNI